MSLTGKRILVVAGDPSGDHNAALLAAELLRRAPELELFGAGGPRMAAAGVDVRDDLVSHSAIGLLDVLPAVLPAKRMLGRLIDDVRTAPPDLAILVDCGAFNLPLARAIKPLGVPVLGFFPPGSWSGSRKRAADVAEAYTAVATPFPQALPAYQTLGLPARLVGHPLVDELAPLRAQMPDAPTDPPILALLPGSRRQEIRHMLVPMLGAARLLRESMPGLRVRVSRAPSAPRRLFDALIERAGGGAEVVEGSRAAMVGATAAIVKSGTVTLEATLLGLPMIGVYRVSTAAYLVASVYMWPRPKWWVMPNILAQETIVPQLFQYRVHPRRLADETAPLLRDTAQRRAMIEGLGRAADRLGGPGATARAADMALDLLARRPIGAGDPAAGANSRPDSGEH